MKILQNFFLYIIYFLYKYRSYRQCVCQKFDKKSGVCLKVVELCYLVVCKRSWDMLTSLLDKSSFGSDWQVPQAHKSREVNLLRGCKLWINIITLILRHFPPWRYDWRVRQTVRLGPVTRVKAQGEDLGLPRNYKKQSLPMWWRIE